METHSFQIVGFGRTLAQKLYHNYNTNNNQSTTAIISWPVGLLYGRSEKYQNKLFFKLCIFYRAKPVFLSATHWVESSLELIFQFQEGVAKTTP